MRNKTCIALFPRLARGNILQAAFGNMLKNIVGLSGVGAESFLVVRFYALFGAL